MSEYQEYGAWIILGIAYIVGGAAIFCPPHVKFKDAIIGWSVINGLVVAVTVVVLSIMWAFKVVTQ